VRDMYLAELGAGQHAYGLGLALGLVRDVLQDTAAARDAVRQAAGRRSGRGAEQVVQVQIGRLEVTATAGPAGGSGNRRPAAAGRQAATVSLAEYLARGRE
ncbi:hypothetical protein AB0I18_44515, partial [Streptomyces sp. NPDC050704]